MGIMLQTLQETANGDYFKINHTANDIALLD